MKNAFVAREVSRWMRPDAHRFLRPGWRRWVKAESEISTVFDVYERKYREDQPRVPSGSREGGQWTGEGGSATEKPGPRIAARISKARQQECEFMHRQDLFICQAVQMRTCYGQAYLRYSNCLEGRQIPPLNF
ncbi:MAG: hypothetical protein JSR72_22790 [Proteobacteria bacterium]|nr:hypothetical protein [Pseudomonadota bacterium]